MARGRPWQGPVTLVARRPEVAMEVNMSGVAGSSAYICKTACCAVLLNCGVWGAALGQEATMSQQGDITIFTAPAQPAATAAASAEEAGGVDFVNAEELELPIAPNFSEAEAELDAIQAITMRPTVDATSVPV